MDGTYKIILKRLPLKQWYMRKTQNEIWLFINKIISKGWGIYTEAYKKDSEIEYTYNGTRYDCDKQREALNKTFSKDTYTAPLRKSWNWLKNKFRKDKVRDNTPTNIDGFDDLQEKIAAFGIIVTEEYSEEDA